MSQIFEILFQTRDMNSFVFRGAKDISRYIQLKSSFSDQKTLVVKSKTHFSREAIEN